VGRPLIALLTDFGTRDHYVAAMKAVALGICPEAVLIDITHEIEPQDVCGGALELAACYRDFPDGTVFLVVVDPGVGSARRAIAAEAGGYRFVAPDNGVLGVVFDATPPARVVELTEPRYARARVTRTFEGRDRFAPAAAWLAAGVDLTALGRPVADPERLRVPRPEVRDAGVVGEIVRVDRFGNLISNIGRALVDALARPRGAAAPEIRVGGRLVAQLVATYAEVAPGEVCALFGSSDHLEVAVRGGSAARALGLGRGAAVHVGRIA